MFQTSHLQPTTWTKEQIASLVSQEQVFQKLGLPVMDEDLGGRFHSPFREDHHADCKLYLAKGSGDLRFYDPSQGLSLDWISLVMYQQQCSYTQALSWIASSFHLIPGSEISDEGKHLKHLTAQRQVSHQPTKISVEARNYTRKDTQWWAQFHITPELLFAHRVWAISDYWINGKHSYCPKGSLSFAYKEDDGYKLYFPEADRRNKWFSSTRALCCYDQLPQSGELLVITSSKKDALCLISFGFPAVAPQGEGMEIPVHLLWELKQRFQRVILFYDSDAPGLKAGAEKCASWQLTATVHIPFTEEAKDPAAYCAAAGSDKALALFTTLLSCTLP